MSSVLVSSESKPITKQLAAWLFSLKSVPRERSIKPARLSQLTADFAESNMIVFKWAYATMGGHDYRLNGQHTSYLFQNGEPIPSGATCVLEHYSCDSMDDVVKLWGLFDSQASSRTKIELTTNVQQAREAIKDCSGKTVRLCQAALAIERYGFGYTNKISMSQKLDCIRTNEPFIIWADKYMQQLHLQRVGVAYGMLKLYRRHTTEASRFMDEMTNGTNPDPKSGTRQLQVFLLSHNDTKGRGGAAVGRAKATWQEMATVIVTCWNYWRKNEPLSRLHKRKDMPEAE